MLTGDWLFVTSSGNPSSIEPMNDPGSARRSQVKTPAFSYSGSELNALANARNYYSWLLKQFSGHLGQSVIEVGAGIGTFAEYIVTAPSVETLIAVEPAANAFPELRRKFEDNPRVTTVNTYLTAGHHLPTADSLVAVNVMEHIEDDAAFARVALDSVRQGGSLLLLVPAMPWIFGTLDSKFEHFRRYTKRTLRSTLEAAGWRIQRLEYANLPGVLAWYLAGRILGKTTISSRETLLYDRWIIPWVFWLEALVSPPIGQSLLVVAEKP